MRDLVEGTESEGQPHCRHRNHMDLFFVILVFSPKKTLIVFYSDKLAVIHCVINRIFLIFIGV